MQLEVGGRERARHAPHVLQIHLFSLILLRLLHVHDVEQALQSVHLLHLHDFLGLGQLNFGVWVLGQVGAPFVDLGERDSIVGRSEIVELLELFLSLRLLLNKLDFATRHVGHSPVDLVLFLIMGRQGRPGIIVVAVLALAKLSDYVREDRLREAVRVCY